MAAYDIAINFGQETSIFLAGAGLVLKESSLIAFNGGIGKKNVRAAGAAAFEMLGKTPEKTVLCQPVKSGVIVEPDAAVILLREFLKRVIPQKILPAKIRAAVCIPCGLSVSERKCYEDVFVEAGITEVIFVDGVMAAAVGMDLPVNKASGMFVMDIGGCVTEIAVISLSGIVAGCSVDVGASLLENSLIDYVAHNYGLEIGQISARKVLSEVGSLYENDTSKISVSGIDIKTRKPSAATVTAGDTLNAQLPYFRKIIACAEQVLTKCPPEVSADIYRTGAFVSGKCAKIAGLEQYIRQKIKLSATVAEDAADCKINGAGKLLSAPALLSEIIKQN